jgi:hypothetical protein
VKTLPVFFVLHKFSLPFHNKTLKPLIFSQVVTKHHILLNDPFRKLELETYYGNRPYQIITLVFDFSGLHREPSKYFLLLQKRRICSVCSSSDSFSFLSKSWKIVSSGFGVIRSLPPSAQAVKCLQQKKWLGVVYHTALGAAEVIGPLFKSKHAIAITSVHDCAQNILQAIHASGKIEKTQDFLSSLHSLAYLASLYTESYICPMLLFEASISESFTSLAAVRSIDRNQGFEKFQVRAREVNSILDRLVFSLAKHISL